MISMRLTGSHLALSALATRPAAEYYLQSISLWSTGERDGRATREPTIQPLPLVVVLLFLLPLSREYAERCGENVVPCSSAGYRIARPYVLRLFFFQGPWIQEMDRGDYVEMGGGWRWIVPYGGVLRYLRVCLDWPRYSILYR